MSVFSALAQAETIFVPLNAQDQARLTKDISKIDVAYRSRNLNVYTAVYKTVSKNTAKGRKGHYSLILLNSRENRISLRTFSTSQYDSAAKEYLDLERKHLALQQNRGN